MTAHADRITLVVPFGTKRHLKLMLPQHVAAWLRDELIDALGKPKPKPRRQPRLHRGRWVARSTH
jgi:hypothetical protein